MSDFDFNLLEGGSHSGNGSKGELEAFRNVPAGTHIVEAIFKGEIVELSPKNTEQIINFTIAGAAEFIKSQSESVTLVIPVNGGIHLAERVIRKLGEDRYNVSEIDLRFVKKVESEEGAVECILDDEEKPINPVVVMIDDIVDSVDTYLSVSEKLNKNFGKERVTCFTPVIKTGNDTHVSTKELAKKNGLTIQELFFYSCGYADINYAAVLPQEWIDSAFGMNSTHAKDMLTKVASINDAEQSEAIFKFMQEFEAINSSNFNGFARSLAEIQTLERLSPVSLAGKPESIAEYGKYLRSLCGNNKNALYNLIFQVEELEFVENELDNKDDILFRMTLVKSYFETLVEILQIMRTPDGNSSEAFGMEIID